jgi:hypothetical protein
MEVNDLFIKKCEEQYNCKVLSHKVEKSGTSHLVTLNVKMDKDKSTAVIKVVSGTSDQNRFNPNKLSMN